MWGQRDMNMNNGDYNRQMSTALYRTLKEIPHTPNLQEQKQKGKSNSRRKQVLNHIAISPTEKMTRQVTQSKLLQDKLQQTQQRGEAAPCINHPEFKGRYFFADNATKRFCVKCKMLLGDNIQHERIEKMYGLGKFKHTLQECTSKATQVEELLKQAMEQEQEKIGSTKASIMAYMSNMRDLIDEKENQLMCCLDQSMEHLQKVRMQILDETVQIKKSFGRYIKDINNNYQDIITQLSYGQYVDILEKYNNKVNYHSEELQKLKIKMSLDYLLNIPIEDIQKNIKKISVSLAIKKIEKYQMKHYVKFDARKHSAKFDSKHYRRGSKQNQMLYGNENCK